GQIIKMRNAMTGMTAAGGAMPILGVALATGMALYSDYRAEKERVIDATNRYKAALEAEGDALLAVNEVVATFLSGNAEANALVEAGLLTHAELAAVIRGEEVRAWDELYDSVHAGGGAYKVGSDALKEYAEQTGLARHEVIGAIEAILTEA